MFTHRAKLQLKPNSYIELSQKIKDKIMPALRLHTGFCDGVTSIDTFWMTATEDTRWKTREDAEAYERIGYPETLKTLSEIIDAEPVTSIFEVSDDGFDQNKITF